MVKRRTSVMVTDYSYIKYEKCKLIGIVRTYLSYPEDKSTQNAIIILTDIMGMDFINVQLYVFH